MLSRGAKKNEDDVFAETSSFAVKLRVQVVAAFLYSRLDNALLLSSCSSPIALHVHHIAGTQHKPDPKDNILNRKALESEQYLNLAMMSKHNF